MVSSQPFLLPITKSSVTTYFCLFSSGHHANLSFVFQMFMEHLPPAGTVLNAGNRIVDKTEVVPVLTKLSGQSGEED